MARTRKKMVARAKTKNFQSIPGSTLGETSLQIVPPNEDPFKRGKYQVYVGGCGVGEANTYQEAHAFLLEAAKHYCRRRAHEAQAVLHHYQDQLGQLDAFGLREK